MAQGTRNGHGVEEYLQKKKKKNLYPIHFKLQIHPPHQKKKKNAQEWAKGAIEKISFCLMFLSCDFTVSALSSEID